MIYNLTHRLCIVCNISIAGDHRHHIVGCHVSDRQGPARGLAEASVARALALQRQERHWVKNERGGSVSSRGGSVSSRGGSVSSRGKKDIGSRKKGVV
jgi:hypothetical protein